MEGGFEELHAQTPDFCAIGHQLAFALAKVLDCNLTYFCQMGMNAILEMFLSPKWGTPCILRLQK